MPEDPHSSPGQGPATETGGMAETFEAQRLEHLWRGEFGAAYSERNADAGAPRQAFWETLLSNHAVRRALEIGCNTGANLRWIAPRLEPGSTYGIDVNREALATLRTRVPGVNAIAAAARELPFRDRWFDLTFTMGVLIHQPESTLPLVMAEAVRTSNRYVLCGEYYSPETVEVPYRGLDGALFKRDYGAIYRQLFPELRLADEGYLGRAEGWDDVTWWLFERP